VLYRIGLVLLLLLFSIPASAEDVLGEVTVNEAFDDSTYETGLTVSGGSIYCQEQDRYGTTGCSLGIDSSITFEFSEDVYEVGFIVGAVNNSYDVKYYYSDGTDETIQKSGQDNSEGPPWANMYDSFYKSFTDYNNDEANTDKFITKFEVNVTDPTVVDTLYWQYVDESTIPTTTTSTITTTTTTTTSTTTTTTVPPTTTTTLPPKPPEPPPPPPPPPEPEKVEVVMDDGSTAEYKPYEVEDGTVDRDNQRKANEDKYGCYMTDAQIERGDCDIPKEEDVIPEEEVIIEVEDTKEEVTDAVVDEVFEDVKVPEKPIEEEVVVPTKEEIIEDIKKDIEEIEFEEEVIVIDIPEDIVIVIEDEETKPDTEGELPDDDIVVPIVEDKPVEEKVEEQIEIIEDIVVEEISEEQVEVITEVVTEVIENVEELNEEQVEVVAEVLQVEAEDVEIIAETAKEDEVIATAVEEYVERAVENADVEDYTFADVVTEIQFEQFLEDPIEVILDIDIADIDITTIGDDMTQDQKEKAQEVVVPVILTRIATMAAFVFRRT